MKILLFIVLMASIRVTLNNISTEDEKAKEFVAFDARISDLDRFLQFIDSLPPEKQNTYVKCLRNWVKRIQQKDIDDQDLYPLTFREYLNKPLLDQYGIIIEKWLNEKHNVHEDILTDKFY